MEKKLTLIGELAEEIKEVSKECSHLRHQQFPQADVIADEIIQKLIYLRNMYASNVSLNTLAPQRNFDWYITRNNGNGQLPLQHANRRAQIVNIKTETILNNDNADLTLVAQNAFENENYAKCVRIIERIAALQKGKLNSTLMNLCHKSYKIVIQSAASNTDRLKLCEWWRLFVESTTLEDSCSEALLLQIDWRSECLQERLKLSRCIVERMAISEMLIMKLIEAYEVAAQSLAPFSVTKMKQRIVELNKVSLVVEEGIELLRLIYSEAKNELDGMSKNNADNESIETISHLMEIMNEIKVVLRHCGWCEVGSEDERVADFADTFSSRNTTAISLNNSTSFTDADCSSDDVIDARF